MSTVNINVAVTPKGTSIDQGVSFAFAPGIGTPSGVLSSSGSVDLSKLYPAGTPVMLAFQITTPSLKFSTGPSVGTFPLSFFGAQNGAKDACWIALQGQNPTIYNGTQFVFGANAMGPGNGSLAITDNNNDGNAYSYALWVWSATMGTSGQRFEDDPRIINHGTNK
jgi:hypothetical protein